MHATPHSIYLPYQYDPTSIHYQEAESEEHSRKHIHVVLYTEGCAI